MKLNLLSLFLLLSIIITSCNTSNKVVSSSFIQKRKYTKGYHFDLLAKNQKRTKSVADNHQALAKQIIPVKKKEIGSWEENRKAPVILNSNSGTYQDFSASLEIGMIIIQQKKNVLADGNFIQPKDSSNEKPDDKSNNIAFIGFLLSFIGLIFIVIMFLIAVQLIDFLPLAFLQFLLEVFLVGLEENK